MAHERLRKELPELFADDTLRQDMPALAPRGAVLVPELLVLAADEALLDESAEGGGWAPLLAAKLLGELQVAEAIPILMEGLRGAEAGWADYDGFLLPLGKLARLDIDVVVAAAQGDDGDGFHEALAMSGVRDPRILELLLARLDADPDLYAGLLSSYGDEAVVPRLLAIFDRIPFRPDDEGPLVHQDLIEIGAAIEELGGDLGTARLAKIDFVVNQRKARRAQDRRPPAERPGRNEACWCGSGKKYKRCHLDEDRR